MSEKFICCLTESEFGLQSTGDLFLSPVFLVKMEWLPISVDFEWPFYEVIIFD